MFRKTRLPYVTFVGLALIAMLAAACAPAAVVAPTAAPTVAPPTTAATSAAPTATVPPPACDPLANAPKVNAGDLGSPDKPIVITFVPSGDSGKITKAGNAIADCLGKMTGLKTSVFLEVEGAAHYLPAYAGNLDIMTSAALATAERMAQSMLNA